MQKKYLITEGVHNHADKTRRSFYYSAFPSTPLVPSTLLFRFAVTVVVVALLDGEIILANTCCRPDKSETRFYEHDRSKS